MMADRIAQTTKRPILVRRNCFSMATRDCIAGL
jgi:hypothetical protein